MNLHKHIMAVILIFLITTIVGCGNGVEAELEALRQACSAGEDVWSYRMEGSSTDIKGEKTTESTLEIHFLAPDRYYGKGYNNGEWEETFITSDRVYSRDSADEEWKEVEVSPEVLEAQKLNLEVSNPGQEATLKLIESLTDLKKLPDEKLDGVDCFHCRGRADIDRRVGKEKAEMKRALDPSNPEHLKKLQAQELIWEWMRKWKIEYELWISREDCLIRQQRYDMQIPAMKSPTGEEMQAEVKSTVFMHYYDINEPIKIEPPEVIPDTGSEK